MTSSTSTDSSRRRVVVAGQYQLMLEALSRALPRSVTLAPRALDSCTSTHAARDHVVRGRPTLVVLVLTRMDGFYAPDLISALADRGQQVLVVRDLSDSSTRRDLVAAGATAVLDGDRLADLASAVDYHLEHGTPPLPRQREAGRARWRRPVAEPTEEQRTRRNLARLTPAEARTLWRLMHGSSVGEIARLHVVSVETVRSHIRATLGKLETTSQLSAVALAWHVEWQPPPAALAA